jgi:oxygen-independent coproporphyrinogen-3 oxidase
VKTPPLSLYVHLPWCVRKCPYCDFNSHTAGDAAPKRRYIDALLKDLQRESERADDRPLQSIFLGGGTPSLFSPDEIAELMRGIRDRFSIVPDAEVTMEANPGTVECGAPAGYLAAGITRLSIGAQSFDDAMLQALGRVHSSADISRAVQDALESGFDNFNIDLMHGLPGQTPETAQADLQAAIDLGPTHVSWYQLTLEPNTVFYARPPANMPDDELAFEIQEQGQALLAEHGYEQYEVSAYARTGRRCVHNMNYWTFGDYLAVGAGAHGKITRGGAAYRYKKPANPSQYMVSLETGALPGPDSMLPRDELIFDFMLNALRLNDGFAEDLFLDRTGLAPEDLSKATENARRRGLIVRNSKRIWKPTGLGSRFLDDLQSEFILEPA